jgi:hypothetical protein
MEGLEKVKSPVFLAAYGYPEAMRERINAHNVFFDAEVVKRSQRFTFYQS